MTFDAFHIPQLTAAEHDGWAEVNGARVPRLRPDGMRAIAARLRAAGLALRARPVEDIVVTVDRAVAHLFDNPERNRQAIDLVARFSGYSTGMVEHVLHRMAADWRAPVLRSLLESEFTDPRVLDQFLNAGKDRARHAAGARVALHIFSGNVPGVAVTSIIRSLLVKCPVLGKTAADEPVFPVLFANALSAVDRTLGEAVAVSYWAGGTRDIEQAAFMEVDQVVHYGGAEAIADARARMPDHVRLVTHGPRLSFGMVARDAIGTAAAALQVARDIAYATAVFDQQGCVSPHTVFVEDNAATTPQALAALVHQELGLIARQLPPSRIDPGEAAAIRAVRTEAEFRAINGEKVSVWGSDRLDHTVLFDPVPALTASCLHRTLKVCPVHDLESVFDMVAPYRDLLQSAGIAAEREAIDRLARRLASVGVSRITSFRKLPWPAATWAHDGRGPLSELVYWTETEL